MYVTITRTSATVYTVDVRTGSHSGTVVENFGGNQTCDSQTGLRYIKFSNNATQDEGGVQQGTIDDVEFYNGVSSLTNKPTNVQDNSILVEKDTGRRYWRTPYSSGTGKIDDLTTDKGWTTSNGISGNGYNASDYVDFKLICPDSSSLAGGRVLVDLQHADYLNGSNLSNTAFTARIKINYSALDQASQNENKSYIGFYSNDSWGGSTQDAFVLQLKLDYGQSSKKFYVEIMNDEVFEGSAHQTEFTSTTPTVDTDYYVEFTKNGNVHTIRITTNDDYTGGETQSITYGGVENLRYFGCKARGDTQANGGNAQGKIEPDIGIWNGVTTVDSTPATWTMEPTFQDDFSSYISTDTAVCRVNPTDDNLDFVASINSANANCSYDIGLTNISETKWVLRFKVDLESYSKMTTGGLNGYLAIGLAENLNNAEDPDCNFIGSRIYYSASNDTLFLSTSTGTTDSNDPTNPAINTSQRAYYVEVKRLSANEATIQYFGNSDYTGSLGGSPTSKTITSSLDSLRYFYVRVFSQGANNAVCDGVIDDVEFYNGVTTIN